MRDVSTRENDLRRANRTTEDERARCCSSSRAVASTRAPAHAGRAGAINRIGRSSLDLDTRLGSHALRTTAVSLSFRLSFATPLEVSNTLKTKATLAVPTLVDTVFGVLPSRTRNSELSEIRQQSWSLLRRHEPAIDHETVRRENRWQVWRRVEPCRAPEERVVVVEHGLECRR